MPYRLDLSNPGTTAFDRLVELGAMDVEPTPDGGLAALMPDSVAPEQIASALRVDDFSISPAIGRDDDSVWVLGLRPIAIAGLRIVPAGREPRPGELRLVDSAAFGTGLHPTTALCLEELQRLTAAFRPDAMLDVGTGSGVLALGALMMGVPRALGIDLDTSALEAARKNARLNDLGARLQLAHGGPETVAGGWPLVVANVLAAPLIEMAPALVRRVAHHGQLVLSGIPVSMGKDVDRAYSHLGMRHVRATSRAGWVALVLQASW